MQMSEKCRQRATGQGRVAVRWRAEGRALLKTFLARESRESFGMLVGLG